jgi:hypothetical protein
MSVNPSPLGGFAAQFFNNNGVILSGGKIYTYVAGTTTPLAVYTSSSGATPHANPIILDSAGRVPGGEIWLTDGSSYKFVVETSTGVLLGTYDNVTGINALTLNADIVVYDPPFTSAVSTNVEAKLAQYVSVKDFGAVGNGVADDTAAFAAAVASFGVIGGAVYVPPGTYKVTSQITLSAPTLIIGAGAKASTIKTANATGNVILFDVAYCQVEKICFDSSVVRTGGSYIAMSKNVIRSRVRDFTMLNGYTGIAATCVDSVWIDTGDIFDTTAGGYGIRLIGDGVTPAGNDIYINKITMSGNANLAAAGIQITNNGAINITDCDIIRHGDGIRIEPGAGEVATSIYIENTYFDTSTNGMWVVPGAGGTVQGVRAVGTWFGNQTGYGVVCAAGGGTCGGIELISPHVSDNATGGILLNGCVDFHMVGGYISATTAGVGNGVTVTAGTSAWSFIGSRIGNGYLKNGNAIGISVAAGASNLYSIIGCDLTGNTTALVDGGTGVNKRITANLGLTPLNGFNVAVGASPFTYTAGGLPETVYVVGGVVSSIVTQGVAVFANSDHTVALGSNETMQITYSVAPTMKSVPHYN